MARQSASDFMELHIRHIQNFMGFAVAFLKKKNPVKLMIEGTTTYIQELLTMNSIYVLMHLGQR